MSRKGQKWDNAEDANLLGHLNHNMSIEEMAKIHGRSEYAIKLRLAKHAMDRVNRGEMSKIAAAKWTRLSLVDLDEYERKRTGAPPDPLADAVTTVFEGVYDLVSNWANGKK